jgi:hypothetical protein
MRFNCNTSEKNRTKNNARNARATYQFASGYGVVSNRQNNSYEDLVFYARGDIARSVLHVAKALETGRYGKIRQVCFT